MRLRVIGCSLLIVVGLGCGGGAPPASDATLPQSTKDRLLQLMEAFRFYQLDHKKAPARPEDFRKYRAAAPFGIEAVSNGDIIVCWGAMIETGGNAANTVLAYGKEAPASGGHVLMQDGAVKQMTAAEFAAAPKASKK